MNGGLPAGGDARRSIGAFGGAGMPTAPRGHFF